MPDEDGYWQSAEPGPAPIQPARGLFQHVGTPWRWKRPQLVCTCVWYFAPGMDMIRGANPECPYVEHQRLAQRREEGP